MGSPKSIGAWPSEATNTTRAGFERRRRGGGLGAGREGEEAGREQKAGEVVDGEPQLVPVLALLPRGAVRRAAADAGVVDQHVQLRGALLDLGGELAHLVQGREVGLERRCAAELRAQLLELLAAASVEQDLCA